MTVLLMILPHKAFACFSQAATSVSLLHLRGNDEDTLLNSLLLGWTDAYTGSNIAKKFLSTSILRLFVDLCDITETATIAVSLKSLMLERMAACLSHCDPATVSLHCQISSDSPVSFIVDMLWQVVIPR